MLSNTELFQASCQQYGLPVMALEDGQHGFQCTIGNRHYVFNEQHYYFNEATVSNVGTNCHQALELLRKNNFPVSAHMLLSHQQLRSKNVAMENLSYPVLAQAITTDGSEQIMCDLYNDDMLRYYAHGLTHSSDTVSLHCFQERLRRYRILVFRGKLIALSECIPVRIIGDGQHTIIELIHLENKRRQQQHYATPLAPIDCSETAIQLYLLKNGIDHEFVPAIGAHIVLCHSTTAAQGAIPMPMNTNIIHQKNIKMFVAATKLLNIDFLDFEFCCGDIGQAFDQCQSEIVAVRACPDLGFYETVGRGLSVSVTQLMLQSLLRRRHPLRYWAQRGRCAYAVLRKMYQQHGARCALYVNFLVVFAWVYWAYHHGTIK